MSGADFQSLIRLCPFHVGKWLEFRKKKNRVHCVTQEHCYAIVWDNVGPYLNSGKFTMEQERREKKSRALDENFIDVKTWLQMHMVSKPKNLDEYAAIPRLSARMKRKCSRKPWHRSFIIKRSSGARHSNTEEKISKSPDTFCQARREQETRQNIKFSWRSTPVFKKNASMFR